MVLFKEALALLKACLISKQQLKRTMIKDDRLYFGGKSISLDFFKKIRLLFYVSIAVVLVLVRSLLLSDLTGYMSLIYYLLTLLLCLAVWLGLLMLVIKKLSDKNAY